MIKNYNAIASNQIRKDALAIIEAGFEAIDTQKIIHSTVAIKNGMLTIKEKAFPLSEKQRLFVIGVGKCALKAAQALEDVLEDKITGGIIVDVQDGTLKRLKLLTGTHPFPTEQNVDATKEIINLLDGLTKDDLVLVIVSGGGSTLLCQPDNFTCHDEKKIMECLFKGGATIEEINTVRKHLSLARGGYLAKHAYPAKVVSLIFMDVAGDKMEVVASGPTFKDASTVHDAEIIMKKHNVENTCGFSAGGLIETPKEDKYFENVENILLISNITALEAMSKKSAELGFKPKIITSTLSGEAKDVGLSIINEIKKSEENSVLLYGGETTVTIKVKGHGGRSQELGLSALQEISDNYLVIPFASDGRDNSDICGVLCDIITKEKAEKLKLNITEYLAENKSYDFWNATKQYIETKDTGANVSDLIIALHKKY